MNNELTKSQLIRIAKYAVRRFTQLALTHEDFDTTIPDLDEIEVEQSETGFNIILNDLPMVSHGSVDYAMTVDYREYGPTDSSGGDQSWKEEEIELLLLVDCVVDSDQLHKAPIKVDLANKTISFGGVSNVKRKVEDINDIDDIENNHYGFTKQDFALRDIDKNDIEFDYNASLASFTTNLPEELFEEE